MNTATALSVLALCLAIPLVSGQEAVRMSLANSQAAEARRAAESTVGFYNVALGPTLWRFHGDLGLEYHSNVYYREAAEGDFIARPGLRVQMRLPITEQNTLTLNLGAGYSFYLQQSGLSRAYITPGSELSFDVFIGDLVVNFHDRFSILQDSYQDPTIYGRGNYAQLENVAGASMLWDLNKLKLRAGYDHVNWIRLSGDPSRPDGQQEVLYVRPGIEFRPKMFTGVELGAVLVDYYEASDLVSDGSQWNAGLFYEAPFSEYISIRASAGYTEFLPDAADDGILEDSSGAYAQLTLRHRLNKHLTYSLTGGKLLSFAYFGGAVDMTTISWDADWNLLHKIGLKTGISYSYGEYEYEGGEEFNHLGGRIAAYRLITEKLTSGLYYSLYSRDSDASGRDYVVHSAGISARYAF